MSPSFAKHLAEFPVALQELIEAELEAGNQIVELSSTFPAPPAGAYVKLAKPVSTRPRESDSSVHFYDRNSSSYSGEFTDGKRFYFVLEPPRPAEPEPDMNAIRAALQAKQLSADAELYATSVRKVEDVVSRKAANSDDSDRYVEAAPSTIESMRSAAPQGTTVVDQFREGMVCTYERWHEGIGYELELLKTATPEELVEIESSLLSRSIDDWRDVEALAALDSPRARVALRQALHSSNSRVRLAVSEYAPNLVSDAERTAALVRALEGSDTYGGLTQALLQVEEYHPLDVIDALLRGTLTRTGDPPVHFAAMLMFLHGKASSAFDWEQRPFFLKFSTEDRHERVHLFEELCEKIGVDSKPLLPDDQ